MRLEPDEGNPSRPVLRGGNGGNVVPLLDLKGPEKTRYYCLYVILDIFSRYVVGWRLASRESGALAEELILVSIPI